MLKSLWRKYVQAEQLLKEMQMLTGVCTNDPTYQVFLLLNTKEAEETGNKSEIVEKCLLQLDIIPDLEKWFLQLEEIT